MFVSSIKCNYSLWFCLFYFSFWCWLSQWLNSLYRFCPLKGHLTHLTMIFLYIWIISQIYSNVSFSLNLFIACLDKALSSGKLYPSVNSNYCILNRDTNYWNIPPVLPWRGNKTFCSPSCSYSPLHAISWLHSALLRIQHSSWLIPQWLCGECVHRTTDWFWWLWTMPWNGQFPAPTVKDNGSIHQLSSAQNIILLLCYVVMLLCNSFQPKLKKKGAAFCSALPATAAMLALHWLCNLSAPRAAGDSQVTPSSWQLCNTYLPCPSDTLILGDFWAQVQHGDKERILWVSSPAPTAAALPEQGKVGGFAQNQSSMSHQFSPRQHIPSNRTLCLITLMEELKRIEEIK